MHTVRESNCSKAKWEYYTIFTLFKQRILVMKQQSGSFTATAFMEAKYLTYTLFYCIIYSG
ncbi:MAG: hypothetical protein ACI9H6_000371 [Patiriisocius sp.]|jgi:hypothetical protein